MLFDLVRQRRPIALDQSRGRDAPSDGAFGGVALLAGGATLFFGILPQPLFDLVHGVGSALGLL